jgi:hypothetical protein
MCRAVVLSAEEMQSVSSAEALAEEMLCARKNAPNTGRFLFSGRAESAAHGQHDCAAECIDRAGACKQNLPLRVSLTPRVSAFADYEAEITGKARNDSQ